MVDRIPSPLLRQIVSYLPKAPDPFVIHRRVENFVSFPGGRDPIKFVVDDTVKCERVKAALENASIVFAHEGTMSEPHSVWETARWMELFDGVLSEEEQETVKAILERKELPVDMLLKVATPAPFGRNGESVFDPGYRKAFEIPRSRIPSGLLEALELKHYHVGNLARAMNPSFKRWTYQLYKIHMYGPGGKFDDHVDTLHQSNHVATVVLSLPSKHVGGILRITHQGETFEFDSAKGPAKSEYGSRMFRYAAFFTDCIHSVQDVISGWRVVVQYDVYEDEHKDHDDDDDDDENQDDGDDDYHENHSQGYDEDTVEDVMSSLERRELLGINVVDREQTALVKAVMQYMTKIPEEHGVAFFLRHRYSLPALNEVVLKGADRVIYDAFSKRDDLFVYIQSVVVFIERSESRPAAVHVRLVSMEYLVPDDNATYWSYENCTVHLIVDSNNGALQISDSGEAGNEPADGYSTYYVACMIIQSY